ncbi:MAG: DHA2 family efflux MFS transporter permease subunit [Solirubrobacteraceae bacterium]
MTLAVLCLSLLVTVLDTTIVNVALPTLDRDLHASASGLEWIVDAYTLVFAGLLIFAGALGDRYGRRLALTGGLLVFGAGSVFAALSATLGELIAARAVMGAGAALVMPATLSILTGVFTDPAERAKAIGIWSAVSGLGIAIGPTLGGVLLERFSWSAIFLINIPVIAIALLAGRRLVPASRAANPPRLDLTGAVLSITGLSALTYSLIQASANGWTSSTTLLSGLAAGCLLATFAVLQLRASDPMVELRLFANPRFGGASAGITALFFALTSATFLLTQIYQFVLGYSPLAAGLRALPPALVVGVVSPLGARVAAKTGPRLPVAAGLMLATCGIGLFTTATANSGYLHYVLAMTIIALGIGLAMAPATQSIMSAVPPHKAGVGSAINDTTRNLGSVLGIAVVGSLVASAYKTGLAPASTHLSEHLVKLTGESVAAATEIAARLPGSTGHQLLSAAHHAFIHAADHGLLIAAAATLIGMLITARSLPATASARAPIGAHEQRVPANA